MVKKLIQDVFSESEAAASIHFKSSTPNRNLIVIFITIAFSLSIIQYGGNPSNIAWITGEILGENWSSAYIKLFYFSSHARLLQLSHWIAFTITGYLIIPFLVIKFVLHEKISTYGFSGKIGIKDLKIYGLMLTVMIPIVMAISFTSSFQHKYPFYQNTTKLPDISLFVWEAEYMIQFFALEFFFRGFFLHGIKQRFGFYSVFVMMIPYCMIHFGKPFPETISAIIAGTALGILSLKSNNIWLGVFIHCSVAITMDICSLWQKGLLG